ncbi:cytochrome P450 [Actinophytocola sp.]|uniref:cytochrome P450 n=1 Tax=Actinophytocola sp. TaxID=1872138 RepID=UPI002D44FE3E|nr:cytochrome P450 [Actinophytocola sp.]HYQ64499.1 cytochrome P450 [Actinophytocola sp.]
MTDSVPTYPFRLPDALSPPPEWARLRAGEPVVRVRLPSGDQALLLTRYDDVRQMLSDPRFTRHPDTADAARVTANEEGGVFGEKLTEDVLHQRWRRVISRAFTTRRVQAIQPRIEETAESLVTAMIERGAPVDLLAVLGFPLPAAVICDQLGVPGTDRDRFAYWSDTMLSMTRYTQAEIDAAQAEFGEYFAKHIAAKRADPGDDLISEFIRFTDEFDGLLTDEMLIATSQGLLVAGYETTAGMIGKMVAHLLAEPDRWARLLADPELVRTAVEEMLRFDPDPGFGIPRHLSADVEVGDHTLPAGTTVVCSIGAANRDDRTFTGADRVDLHRTPNQHLAFGIGPHSCVGQALARVELQTVLRVLLRRLPTLELAEPAAALAVREGLVVGGLTRVLVRW